VNGPIRFCFGLHLHQPVGNFDSVFRDHLDSVYGPLLTGLESGDTWPVTIHVSGPLLDWLETHATHWVDRLAGHVARGRIELLAAGHDEPILVALSSDDRTEQVVRHRERLERRFGVEVRGLWLTERVWESDLPRDLSRAGIEFVVVDDRHLRVAGVPRDELHGPSVTEYDGHTVTVMAIDQRLRYLVPFRPVDELEHFFAQLNDNGHSLAVLADDGEKFGGWPGTAKWVWQDGWFASFSETLSRLRDANAVVLSTMAEAIRSLPPRGPVYLPSASYHEMERWALPPVQSRRLAHLEDVPLLSEAGADDEALLRGSHWRNFLTRYPESNRLHKVMQHLSRACRAAGDPADVRLHVGRAQCNDAYWHGVFGGIYLPFLRGALWRELAQAAHLLFSGQPISVESFDIDCDGSPEVVVSSGQLFAVIAPHRGGAIEVLLDLTAGVNLADTMTRHEEAYHPVDSPDGLDESPIDELNQDAPPSIHDLETTLDSRPPLDVIPRALLVDRFLESREAAAALASGHQPALGEIATGRLEGKVDSSHRETTITCHTTDFSKVIHIRDDGIISVEWQWNPAAFQPGADAIFTTELSLANLVDIAGDWTERIDYPIETVAKSEGGFDRTLQGYAVVLCWPASAGAARLEIRR
jgi:hypothetical protein